MRRRQYSPRSPYGDAWPLMLLMLTELSVESRLGILFDNVLPGLKLPVLWYHPDEVLFETIGYVVRGEFASPTCDRAHVTEPCIQAIILILVVTVQVIHGVFVHIWGLNKWQGPPTGVFLIKDCARCLSSFITSASCKRLYLDMLTAICLDRIPCILMSIWVVFRLFRYIFPSWLLNLNL
jgi:hypothetical protein